jgi:hypothetical protein
MRRRNVVAAAAAAAARESARGSGLMTASTAATESGMAPRVVGTLEWSGVG